MYYSRFSRVACSIFKWESPKINTRGQGKVRERGSLFKYSLKFLVKEEKYQRKNTRCPFSPTRYFLQSKMCSDGEEGGEKESVSHITSKPSGWLKVTRRLQNYCPKKWIKKRVMTWQLCQSILCLSTKKWKDVFLSQKSFTYLLIFPQNPKRTIAPFCPLWNKLSSWRVISFSLHEERWTFLWRVSFRELLQLWEVL